MALLRSLPENAALADLRRTYADLRKKLRPYGQRLMRGLSTRPMSALGVKRTWTKRRVRSALDPKRTLGLPPNIENIQNGAIWCFFARASSYCLCQKPLQLL